MKLRVWETEKDKRDIVVDDHQAVRLGRNQTCDVAFEHVRFAKVSGLHAELVRRGKSVYLVHRSQSNKTLHNDQPVDQPCKVKVGDRIRLGFTGPTIEIVSLDGDDRSPATMATPVRAAELLRGSVSAGKFEIGNGGTIGRDAAQVQFLLDHPHVSRVHARLTCAGGRVAIADLGSANGTYVNGHRLIDRRELAVDDIVDIGPFSLQFDGKNLVSRSRANNVQLVASGVSRTVHDAARKKPLPLLQDVTLVINPGELLCILGPSGSGKSTLLGVISGRDQPSGGQVDINGRDLHAHFAALKEDIAIVPQNATLHESLTVEQTMRFTAALRLPPDLGRAEVAAEVDKILETVGLSHRRGVRIRQLSGGQVKRAGLGVELLAEPSLLFLDEVTSGLDEHSDGEMMRLFRSLADAGKTLVCVTHNLSHVDANCHLVAVLTVGGRLAFFGSPVEAKRYFQVDKLADVYLKLETRKPEEWSAAFLKSPEHAVHIRERMSAPTRATTQSTIDQGRPRPSFLRQVTVLISRYIAIWRGDLQALGALFGQALLVAILLGLVFGNLDGTDLDAMTRLTKIRNLLFLVGVSCFWLACNNSVKEIVKERRIYQRERDFNLIPEAYLGSKLLVMAVVGIVQSLMLGASVFLWCSMPGPLSWQLVTLAALSSAGTAIGLAISAVAKSEELAVALVPIVVIPQIILAGVVAGLPKFPEWLARVSVTVFWGQKAAETCLPQVDRILSAFSPSFSGCLFAIGVHTCLLIGMAWRGVRRKS